MVLMGYLFIIRLFFNMALTYYMDINHVCLIVHVFIPNSLCMSTLIPIQKKKFVRFK